MGEVVVLDCGTHSTKAGLSGESVPRLVIPTVVGKIPHHASSERAIRTSSHRERPCYVGCEALVRRNSTTLVRPVTWGRITDWDAMYQIWRGVIEDDLHIDHTHHPVILTETIAAAPRTRELKTEIFFEDFNVPRFSLVAQSALSLYASGRTAGVVVDIGAGQSSVLPFFQGKSLPQGMVNLHYSGDDITNYLLNSLKSFGFRLGSSVHRELANDIKERICRVPINTPNSPPTTSAQYTLPDRTTINLTPSQRIAPFKPLFTGPNSLSISVTNAMSFLERNITTDIVLSGGTTDTPGFRDSLEALLPGSGSIVRSGVEARFMPWVGGSVLGSLDTFNRMSISKVEYSEHGSGLINHRCYMEHSLDDSHVLYEFCGA